MSPEPRLLGGGEGSAPWSMVGRWILRGRWDQVSDEVGPLEEQWRPRPLPHPLSPAPKLFGFPATSGVTSDKGGARARGTHRQKQNSENLGEGESETNTRHRAGVGENQWLETRAAPQPLTGTRKGEHSNGQGPRTPAGCCFHTLASPAPPTQTGCLRICSSEQVDLFLLCSPPQSPEQRLAQSRCSGNICRVSEGRKYL